MKSNSVTKGIAGVLLVLFFLWALFSLSFTSTLICASVGLITYGSTNSLEVSGLAAIVLGAAMHLYNICKVNEGFEANALGVIQPGGPAYAADAGQHNESTGDHKPFGNDAVDIAKRIEKMSKGEIKGMLSNNYMEGFADASVVDEAVPDAGSNGKKKDDAAVASDKPAEVKESTEVSDTMKKDLPIKEALSSFSKDGANPDSTALFRLGSIPTDAAGGPHIDASTTLMSALNALKPDQIKSMTEDTRKLMETQKNLMGMLHSMKPMLQDGKQMLETFGTMFNK